MTDAISASTPSTQISTSSTIPPYSLANPSDQTIEHESGTVGLTETQAWLNGLKIFITTFGILGLTVLLLSGLTKAQEVQVSQEPAERLVGQAVQNATATTAELLEEMMKEVQDFKVALLAEVKELRVAVMSLRNGSA